MSGAAATPSGESSRGVILVIVLWAVAMMTVMVAALSAGVRKDSGLAEIETDRLKSQMLVEGAVEVAAAKLLAGQDAARSLADGRPYRVDMGAGIVETRVRDAGGLIDINRADAELLTGFFGAIAGSDKAAEALARQIVDWRDKQSGATVTDAPTETPEESDINAEPKPKPAAFITTSQLYRLAGADRSLIDRALPFLSLFSRDGRINLATAPDEVLAGVPGIAPADIKMLTKARAAADWDGIEVKEIADRLKAFVSLDDSGVFIVDASVIAGNGLIAGTRLEATIMMDWAGQQPVHVVGWSW